MDYRKYSFIYDKVFLSLTQDLKLSFLKYQFMSLWKPPKNYKFFKKGHFSLEIAKGSIMAILI